MSKKSFIIKGDICFSRNKDELKTEKDGYLVCVDGISKGVFSEIPYEYKELEFFDYSGNLVMPGLVDLHVHAPQYTYSGLGMDLELLDWLNTYTFPHEAKYVDEEYAKKKYKHFVDDIRRGPNTRSVVFATIHVPATKILMDLFENSGLVSYIGKVNMDRNGGVNLQETTKQSEEDTRAWIKDTVNKYDRTFPIITPRFTPTCSDELMKKLHEIQREHNVSVQSHISENHGEIAWVSELCPNTKFYGEAYDQFGMFGGDCHTVMAHCVWSSEDEQALIKKRGVFIAHCPNSNTNIASGIAPVSKFLQENQKIGLGSDVAGGAHLSIFRAMEDAIGVSKLRWKLVDDKYAPLTAIQAFYMGTLGGGEFFGKVGSFDVGYEFDAIILDESRFTDDEKWSIEQRLERAIYLSQDEDIVHKFVQGEQLF